MISFMREKIIIKHCNPLLFTRKFAEKTKCHGLIKVVICSIFEEIQHCFEINNKANVS